LKSFNGK